MCFSAAASLTAAAGLTAAGSATVRKAKHKDQKILAMIPLLFAIHQASEGVVWLTIDKSPEFNSLFATIYLLIAYCLWPILFPTAALMIEKSHTKKHLIAFIVLIGTALSLFTVYQFQTLGFKAELINGNLYYNFAPYQSHPVLLTITYCSCLSLPYLINKNKILRILGLAVIISLLYTLVLYPTKVVPSVWCFFGALLSLIIYIYITNEK